MAVRAVVVRKTEFDSPLPPFLLNQEKSNETNIKKTNKKDFSIIAEIYAKEFSKPPYNEPWTKKKAIEK